MAMNSNITLPTKKVTGVLEAFNQEQETEEQKLELDVSNGKVKLELDKLPKEFLGLLVASNLLTPAQTKKIAMFGTSRDELLDKEVRNIRELYTCLIPFLSTTKSEFPFVLRYEGKFYPILFSAHYQDHPWLGRQIMGGIRLQICDKTVVERWHWAESDFIDPINGQKIKKVVRDLLKDQGLELATDEHIEEYKRCITLADKMNARSKTVHDVVGPVLVENNFFWSTRLEAQILGTKKSPRKVIVENDLELTQERDNYWDNDQTIRLPFVRIFSLDLKKYVYVDTSYISEHEFDMTARDKIVLEGGMRNILDSVFEVDSDDIFGDMFGGRHGGMIILANGTSGVGKTLTAEVYSEYTHRPLYVLEMGELGTNLENVEANLTRIFMRAKRWNAILLFDECDVFLSKRGEDLDRNAIVGVFLRLLDHYDGAMFLTTNRAEVIDDAFKSRITLKLDYPKLSSEARRQVWRNLLASAKFTHDDSPDFWEGIDSENINGRQIRNIVRLLKIVVKGTELKRDDIINLFKYSAK